jgi:hypothetical protein
MSDLHILYGLTYSSIAGGIIAPCLNWLPSKMEVFQQVLINLLSCIPNIVNGGSRIVGCGKSPSPLPAEKE